MGPDVVKLQRPAGPGGERAVGGGKRDFGRRGNDDAIDRRDDGQLLDLLAAADELGIDGSECFLPLGELQVRRIVGVGALAKSIEPRGKLLTLVLQDSLTEAS